MNLEETLRKYATQEQYNRAIRELPDYLAKDSRNVRRQRNIDISFALSPKDTEKALIYMINQKIITKKVALTIIDIIYNQYIKQFKRKI